MCEWGDEVLMLVPIPASHSHTGISRWARKGVDRCIAPLVHRLNATGIWTAGSCCGHGRSDGTIVLQDGRVLTLQEARVMTEVIGQEAIDLTNYNIPVVEGVVGEVYDVRAEDCCVSVYFRSKLVTLDVNDEEYMVTSLWENGVRLESQSVYLDRVTE